MRWATGCGVRPSRAGRGGDLTIPVARSHDQRCHGLDPTGWAAFERWAGTFGNDGFWAGLRLTTSEEIVSAQHVGCRQMRA